MEKNNGKEIIKCIIYFFNTFIRHFFYTNTKYLSYSLLSLLTMHLKNKAKHKRLEKIYTFETDSK